MSTWGASFFASRFLTSLDACRGSRSIGRRAPSTLGRELRLATRLATPSAAPPTSAPTAPRASVPRTDSADVPPLAFDCVFLARGVRELLVPLRAAAVLREPLLALREPLLALREPVLALREPVPALRDAVLALGELPPLAPLPVLALPPLVPL